ncbi:hypothetical protein [Pseudomonas frederiksbergensis]|uniref:Uncharacterized protein n=1 Tax=Pseudomonas frederiksbergensis TaxID=104087 RepID=A0A423KNG9_9PSED|nr:hypothetical protein [Pseudomonas frederiksbergensis]RON55936.1 hypothetical protein BK665_08200 [Pseudomonas frederiksbergensis]
MGKNLRVLDENFATQKAAHRFFYDIRDKYYASKLKISSSREFDLLSDLYSRYCTYTNHLTPGQAIAFYVRDVHRGSGKYGGITQGFVAVFANGEEIEFSAEKAIVSLGNQEAQSKKPN